MQRTAEFYHPSTGWNGRDFSGPVQLIPACGSDSILPLDGRLSLSSCARLARETCLRRGFQGFTLHAGQMNRPEYREIRPLEIVTPSEV